MAAATLSCRWAKGWSWRGRSHSQPVRANFSARRASRASSSDRPEFALSSERGTPTLPIASISRDRSSSRSSGTSDVANGPSTGIAPASATWPRNLASNETRPLPPGPRGGGAGGPGTSRPACTLFQCPCGGSTTPCVRRSLRNPTSLTPILVARSRIGADQANSRTSSGRVRKVSSRYIGGLSEMGISPGR